MLLLMLKPCHWNVQEYNLLSKIIKYIPLNDKGKSKNLIGNMLTVVKNIFLKLGYIFIQKKILKFYVFKTNTCRMKTKVMG